MIKANELRIGNALHTNNDGETQVVIVAAIHPGEIMVNVKSKFFKADFVRCDPEQLFYIPLSPEILEACGFVGWRRQVSLNMGYEGGDIFFGIPDGSETMRGQDYRKYKHDFIIGCVLGKKISADAHECTFWYGRGGSKKGLQIESLHQLQNLYYSLTNQELSVKLPVNT